MFGLRRHKAFRRAAWLALIAVLFQALLPALHHPAARAFSGPFALAGNLCVAPASGPSAPTDPDKAPAHKLPPCPICQTFQMLGAGYVPPSPTTLIVPEGPRSIPVLAADNSVCPRRVSTSAQARAPPLRA